MLCEGPAAVQPQVVPVAQQQAAGRVLVVVCRICRPLEGTDDLLLGGDQVARQELGEPRLGEQARVQRRVGERRRLERPDAAELHAGRAPEEEPRHGVDVLGPAVLHGEVERRQAGELLGEGGLEPLRARAPEDHELRRRRQPLEQVDTCRCGRSADAAPSALQPDGAAAAARPAESAASATRARRRPPAARPGVSPRLHARAWYDAAALRETTRRHWQAGRGTT